MLNTSISLLVSCPTLSDPSNGVINCSLGDDGVPSYEDTCTFTCDTGYELTGSESRTCQINGTWSGDITMCNRGEHIILSSIQQLELLLLLTHKNFHKKIKKSLL